MCPPDACRFFLLLVANQALLAFCVYNIYVLQIWSPETDFIHPNLKKHVVPSNLSSPNFKQ